MKIAVLFDGAGLARLGLEQAGHDCTGFELDPSKHFLSKFVGSGNCVLADVKDVNLKNFEAIWASPPCQKWSVATKGNATKDTDYSDENLLDWSISLVKKFPDKIVWVENVLSEKRFNLWGTKYNAAQFLETPIQNRNRIIGGNYIAPNVFRKYQYSYPKLNICPCILATPPRNVNKRWPSRYYNRGMSVRETAYHQGFEIPDTLCKSWFHNPLKISNQTFTNIQWRNNLYQGIGNGVPVYMAKAFGEVYQ